MTSTHEPGLALLVSNRPARHPASNTRSDGRRRVTDTDLEWLSVLIKLRATGMPVRDIRRALRAQRECLRLLDTKINHYEDCLAVAEADNA
jgi:DNA-binding transcriptional MerR regulator